MAESIIVTAEYNAHKICTADLRVSTQLQSGLQVISFANSEPKGTVMFSVVLHELFQAHRVHTYLSCISQYSLLLQNKVLVVLPGNAGWLVL